MDESCRNFPRLIEKKCRNFSDDGCTRAKLSRCCLTPLNAATHLSQRLRALAYSASILSRWNYEVITLLVKIVAKARPRAKACDTRGTITCLKKGRPSFLFGLLSRSVARITSRSDCTLKLRHRLCVLRV